MSGPSSRIASARWLPIAVVLAFCLPATGCEQGPSDEELAQAHQLAEARRQMEAKEAAEQAARQKAEAEAAAAEAAKIAAAASKKAAVLLADCCTALGKAAFEGRSMAFQKAADLCEAAQNEEDQVLADVLPAIKMALTEDEKETEKLVPECSAGSAETAAPSSPTPSSPTPSSPAPSSPAPSSPAQP